MPLKHFIGFLLLQIVAMFTTPNLVVSLIVAVGLIIGILWITTSRKALCQLAL